MDTKKIEILNYLQGPRRYTEGVELYAKYGENKHLAQTFLRMGVTQSSRDMLMEELRKTAGISEAEFKKIRQQATTPKIEIPAPKVEKPKTVEPETEKILLELAEMFGVSVDELVIPETRMKIIEYYKNEKEDGEVTADKLAELENYLDDLGIDAEDLADVIDDKDRTIAKLTKSLEAAEKKYQAAPPATVKMIHFRERFPFLNDEDCPDVLKILVSDMFTAYGKYKEAHAKLAAMPDDAEALETARLSEEIVENFIKDREIWEELEYYQEHHELLGKCEKVKALQNSQELTGLDDMALMKKRQSAAAQISKQKKIVEDKKADAEKKAAASKTLEEWTAKKKAIDEEIERRKKK